MDAGDVLCYGCVMLTVIFGSVVGYAAYGDAVNSLPYHNETATIDSITQHGAYYEYELNISGSKIDIKSVDYYNLSDELSVIIRRGSGSGMIVDTVFINGVV